MAIDITIPELGENVDTAEVGTILVAEGDTIDKDAPLLELETDKAVAEVPSSEAGTVSRIHVASGDTVSVGQVIVSLEPGDAGANGAPVEAAVEGTADNTSTGDEATDGDAGVTTGKPPATDSEADPASAPPPDRQTERPLGPPAAETASPPTGARRASDVPVAAAPSVRRLAREIGVDITAVRGTGDHGRISLDDVKRTAKELLSGGGGSTVGGGESRQLPDFAKWGRVHAERMNKIRQVTADHLSYAWRTIPHVTQQDLADITNIERLRKQYKDRAEAAGGKLTVTAVLVKVVATALRRFPQFNASVDPNRNEVIYKEYVHIGIAVDTDNGLLVPVIRDVDKKSMVDISVELGEIAARARDRKLTAEQMSGGCFSISNLGGIGGAHFTPIVNWPEVAILGVSRARKRPVYGPDGDLEPRLLMPLSLSYDHRLIDGADGVRFLRFVVEALEEPFLLSLD